MKRRAFVAGFGAACLVPKMIAAKPATPVSGERKYISDFLGNVKRPDRAGYRSFDLPNPGLFNEGLGWFVAYAMKFGDITAARAFVLAFPDAFRRWDLWDRDPPMTGSAARPANVRNLGEQNWAWTFKVTNTESGTSWERGVTAVRKDTWVQIMVGSALIGSTVVALSDIAEKTVERWPNRSTTSLKDGLYVGDIFAALPVLADIPEGASIDEDRQVQF